MEYTLKLTASDLDVIVAALKEIPWKHANPLLLTLQTQCHEQQQNVNNIVPIKEKDHA